MGKDCGLVIAHCSKVTSEELWAGVSIMVAESGVSVTLVVPLSACSYARVRLDACRLLLSHSFSAPQGTGLGRALCDKGPPGRSAAPPSSDSATTLVRTDRRANSLTRGAAVLPATVSYTHNTALSLRNERYSLMADIDECTESQS
ncbi:hypothetical protein ROHU_008597 [Labeo rohita]|uniref:Uncharacterized protein n=1 Tax=Labeo rohita TaxID=84645 RepID=A0A498M969_LABRO|nr:hypothetical protein ROHU_008597 [Labeo rohita]